MKRILAGQRVLLWLAVAASALGWRGFAQAPGLSLQINAGYPILSITGLVNSAYSVQYQANLSQPGNWSVLSTLVLTSNPCVWADTSATGAAQRFYRVVATNLTVTVTDAQLQDMCSRTCDTLTASSKIPETITVGGGNTSTVSAAELYYLMVKWLQYYKNHNSPPATVTITGGICPPGVASGIESGNIYLADILAVSETAVAYIDANRALPSNSTVLTTQYTTRAMFSVFARTINWYQDHSATMPAYASVRTVAAPDSWASGIKVAVLSDPNGSFTMVECVNATLDILRTNAGFNASAVTAATITNGGLDAFQVVMFPGGSAGGQATVLGQDGCAKVEQFVARGGGYIGTCAGAYLAALGYAPSTLWLNIVDAQIIDLDNWARGQGWPQIHLVNPSHPILAGFSQDLSVRYINGPLLGPGNSVSLPDYEQEAVFVGDIHDSGPVGIMPGTTCLTCSSYGAGRCVLFSFHPELSSGLEQMDVRAVKWAAGKL